MRLHTMAEFGTQAVHDQRPLFTYRFLSIWQSTSYLDGSGLGVDGVWADVAFRHPTALLCQWPPLAFTPNPTMSE